MDVSNAFEKLVMNDDDLVGYIAYALYKKQKRELALEKSLPQDDTRLKCYHEHSY